MADESREEIEKEIRRRLEEERERWKAAGSPPPAPSGPPITFTCPASGASVRVKTVAADAESKNPVMILTDPGEFMYLPVWIGQFEGTAIRAAIDGTATARPMTYDLFRAALEACEARVVRVTITELREQTYFARLTIARGGMETDLDSRPSDAVALALRHNAPIYVAGAVINAAAIPDREKALAAHPDGKVELG